LRLAANPAGSREAARARRRGDRRRKFAAMRMSAFWHKADMCTAGFRSCLCPLRVKSRLRVCAYRWWQHRRGWQRPLDSERFKMGARKALIRSRFYKKRDCKKLADSGRRTGDSSREAPWRVLLVVA
jgi:hypothetical protein